MGQRVDTRRDGLTRAVLVGDVDGGANSVQVEVLAHFLHQVYGQQGN